MSNRQPIFNPMSKWFFRFGEGTITYFVAGTPFVYTMDPDNPKSRLRFLRDTMVGWKGMIGVLFIGLKVAGWRMTHPDNFYTAVTAASRNLVRKSAAGHADDQGLMFDDSRSGVYQLRKRPGA